MFSSSKVRHSSTPQSTQSVDGGVIISVSGSTLALVSDDSPDMNDLKSVAKSSMPTTGSPVIWEAKER